MEPAEKAAFEKDFEFWSDGAPSMWVWHDNLLMGSHDLNGVTASFERSGLPHFRREENLIYQARAIADQITDILNIRRRERQLPTIQTMAEVRQERHQDDFDIIVAMASLTRPPKDSQDIEPALLACGCEIIWNRRALIRLLKPGKSITTLNKEKALEQVKEAREKLPQRDQIIPEKPSPPPSPLDII